MRGPRNPSSRFSKLNDAVTSRDPAFQVVTVAPGLVQVAACLWRAAEGDREVARSILRGSMLGGRKGTLQHSDLAWATRRLERSRTGHDRFRGHVRCKSARIFRSAGGLHSWKSCRMTSLVCTSDYGCHQSKKLLAQCDPVEVAYIYFAANPPDLWLWMSI